MGHKTAESQKGCAVIEMKKWIEKDNYGDLTISSNGRQALTHLLSDIQRPNTERITEKDLMDLPEVVKRYLRNSGVLNKHRYQVVRLKQKGEMRRSPSDKWIPLRAVEYYTTNPPGFVWFGSADFSPIIKAKALDSYIQGNGNMLVKVASFFTMFDQKGEAMDRACLMRYLNEMTWFPTAFLNDFITWEQIDSRSAIVKIADRGMEAEATMYFDDLGNLVDFVADRPRMEGKELVTRRWRTPIKENGPMAGLNLPLAGEAVWLLDTGDFSYIRLRIFDIEFDPPSITGRE